MSLSLEPTRATELGLNPEQLGHIRRIESLSKLLPNDWSGMQAKANGQDDFGGYRFQLAYGAYALALAYRHRLPNAPGVFKPTFARLIEKILLPEVWMYWRDTSRGGTVFNAHLSDQYHEEWNPVVRDNIMYSAYVQSMAAMFNVLFDDNRYIQPGALSFDYWSFFWGGEPKSYQYDQNSLTEHLYWKMVESGYLGIACEPNCIFQICNQPAIIGFRMSDLLTGGNLAEDVTAGYKQAWADHGRIDANGHYVMMVLEDSKTFLPNADKNPWIDAWCGTLMNTWNREFVREHYPQQVADLLTKGPDGTISVVSPPPLEVMGQLVIKDTCDFGWVAAWASEMGDNETLDGLLAHADRYMNPTWADGALYYPRNDTPTDADGNRTLVEPLTGNSLLAYARLNVSDGLWSLYNEPWDRSHHSEPLVVEVTDSVDLTRADFDRTTRALTMRTAQRAGHKEAARLGIQNVADVTLTVDGRAADPDATARQGDLIWITCPEGGPHELVLTAPGWIAQ